MFLNVSVLQGGVVSTSPNPRPGGPPLVGCPRLIIQFIRSYPPYRGPFLYPQPKDVPCRGDRDPLHGHNGPIILYYNIMGPPSICGTSLTEKSLCGAYLYKCDGSCFMLYYEDESHENLKLHVARVAAIFTLLLRRRVAFLHRTATCRPLFKPSVSLLSTYKTIELCFEFLSHF